MAAGLFAVGIWMVDLNYYSEWYKTAPYWHKSVGLTLAGMTLLRVLVRLFKKAPKPLGSTMENYLAAAVHLALYIGLFALFLSGYLISTADGRGIEVAGLFTVPSIGELIENQEDVAGEVHEFVAWTLLLTAAMHAAAALKHHFISKDSTLIRMIKPY